MKKIYYNSKIIWNICKDIEFFLCYRTRSPLLFKNYLDAQKQHSRYLTCFFKLCLLRQNLVQQCWELHVLVYPIDQAKFVPVWLIQLNCVYGESPIPSDNVTTRTSNVFPVHQNKPIKWKFADEFVSEF